MSSHSDPIRARLNERERLADPEYDDLQDALRAVLDLCDEWTDVYAADIRRVIAEEIGVTDALEAGVAIDWEPVSETTMNMMRAMRGDFNGD